MPPVPGQVSLLIEDGAGAIAVVEGQQLDVGLTL